MRHIRYYHLYSLVNNPIIIAIRFLGYIILTFFLFKFQMVGQDIGQKLIALYLLFVFNEWFIMLGLNRKFPDQRVGTDDAHLGENLLFPVRHDFENSSLEEFLIKASHKVEVKILLQKLSGEYKSSPTEITKNDVLNEAATLVKAAHGLYISYLDLFVAYLFLSEGVTHFLEKQGISRQDIEGLHFWIRSKEEVDHKRPLKILFTGGGVFDFFIYGWNTELTHYALDLTEATLHSKTIPVFVGRNEEYKQFIQALFNTHANNALIIGEPGTGRETLVNYFAYESFMGLLGSLSHKRVYEVKIDRIVAGINNNGELEERLGEILSEIEHSGNVAILIKNIENIFGGGGFNLDLSGVIIPYLKNAHIPLIGITTPSAFKMYFEDKEEVKGLFEIVKIDEPDDYTAHFMVMEKALEIEKANNITVTYDAIKEVISLSSSYLPEEFLPGRAVKLLEDTVGHVMFDNQHVIEAINVQEFVQEKTKIILTDPTKEEKDKLLHLEEEIHKRLIDQEEAVHAIASSLRRLRSGFTSNKRPISTFLFLGPTGVGKTELAKALAAIYFGDESNMIRLDMSEYQTQDSLKRILGGFTTDEKSIKTITDQVREKPFSVILLDEFEKAHPQILDLFLQILDEGRVTDNKGRSISFVNTIIIATSNAGSEFIREHINQGEDFNEVKNELVNDLLSKNIFKPELLNRFDEVVMFKPLSAQDALQVASLLLTASLKRLEEKGIYLKATDAILERIVNEGYNQEFGGRNLRRYIDSHIEEFISNEILSEKLTKGVHGTLTLTGTNEFVVV